MKLGFQCGDVFFVFVFFLARFNGFSDVVRSFFVIGQVAREFLKKKNKQLLCSRFFPFTQLKTPQVPSVNIAISVCGEWRSLNTLLNAKHCLFYSTLPGILLFSLTK